MCWQCDHPEATYDDWLDHVRRILDRNGVTVVAVEPARRRPPFAYTVGLTPLGLPELLVTGLRDGSADDVLLSVADHVRRGAVVLPGEVLHLGSRHLEAVAVARPDAHLLTATALYGDDVRGLQLVWADDRGRLPWEPGHRAGRGGQPVLGRRATVPAR